MESTLLPRISLPDALPYILGQKTDNSSVQNSILVVNGVCLSLVILSTGLRFWVRYGMLRSAGLDDLMMLLASVFATLLSISAFLSGHYGLGKHLWNLAPGHPENIPVPVAKITKALFGCYLAYSTAMAFTKYTIMATYFRVFPDKNLRKAVIVCGVIVTGIWISSIFAIIFTCVPVQSVWDHSVPGYCYPIVNFFYASASINILTDILLCVIPIPALWSLSMPRGQRIMLCGLFCGGAFACVASVLRLTHLYHLNDGVDFSYETVSSLNWSVVEVDTGIVCASITALRPLGRYLLPSLFPKNSTSGRAYAKGVSIPMVSPHSAPTQHTLKNGVYVSRTFEITTNDENASSPTKPHFGTHSTTSRSAQVEGMSLEEILNEKSATLKRNNMGLSSVVEAEEGRAVGETPDTKGSDTSPMTPTSSQGQHERAESARTEASTLRGRAGSSSSMEAALCGLDTARGRDARPSTGPVQWIRGRVQGMRRI